jgi:hypothetical protein
MVIGTTGRAYAVPLAGEVETIDSWNGTLWQLRRSLAGAARGIGPAPARRTRSADARSFGIT